MIKAQKCAQALCRRENKGTARAVMFLELSVSVGIGMYSDGVWKIK